MNEGTVSGRLVRL